MAFEEFNPYQPPTLSEKNWTAVERAAADQTTAKRPWLVLILLTIFVVVPGTILINWLDGLNDFPIPPGIACTIFNSMWILACCVYTARWNFLLFKHGVLQAVTLGTWAATFVTVCLFLGRFLSQSDQTTFALVYLGTALVTAAAVQLFHYLAGQLP